MVYSRQSRADQQQATLNRERFGRGTHTCNCPAQLQRAKVALSRHYQSNRQTYLGATEIHPNAGNGGT